jgi:hypothetical protein
MAMPHAQVGLPLTAPGARAVRAHHSRCMPPQPIMPVPPIKNGMTTVVSKDSVMTDATVSAAVIDDVCSLAAGVEGRASGND